MYQRNSSPGGIALSVSATACSDVGRVRKHNEDTIALCEPSDQVQLEQLGRLYLLADGAGGHAVTWSPDSTRIASSCSSSREETVHVWYAANGNPVCRYHGHSWSINALTWSPSGMYIASGGDDMTVQVWDATTGHSIFTYRGHAVALWDYVEAVSWSPDGTRIVSGSEDRKVHVWAAP